MRRSLIIWGCLLLALLVMGHAAEAREVTVILKDGTPIKGDLVGENDNSITLLISNIQRQISRDNIQEIRVPQTPTEVFNQRKSELEADDVRGRYGLAQWAYEQGHFQLALNELKLLARDFPDHEYSRRVDLLSRAVTAAIERQQREEQERQALIDRQGRGGAARPADPQQQAVPVGVEEVSVEQPGAERPTRPGRADRWVLKETDLLSEEQINLIRVYEIDLSERPTVVVRPEAIEALFKTHAGDEAVPKGRLEQARFRGMPGYVQLETIFDAGAKELYRSVIVRDDPPAMQYFKRALHRTYVIGYCGQCHGNGEAEGLFVVRDRPASNTTAYTNFYLLSQVENVRGRMLDRSRPEDSLLVQYGLPREDARTPHPDVEGYRPAFFGDWERNPQYRQLIEWIGDELYRPAPNYGIRWDPPARPAAEDVVPDPAERVIDVGGGE